MGMMSCALADKPEPMRKLRVVRKYERQWIGHLSEVRVTQVSTGTE